MSMYSQFKTDAKLEAKGVVIDYGAFRVTIARAGGSNTRYRKALESESKPYRRALATETIDPEVAEDIMRRVYAQTIVLNWEVNENYGKKGPNGEPFEAKWKKGIEGPEGDILQVTEKNLVMTFKNLPDLFTDLQQQASKIALFRQDLLESDAGN